MLQSSCLLLGTSLLLVILNRASAAAALECWKCTSEKDVTCRDYFNISRIQANRRFLAVANYGRQQQVGTNPQLEICDDRYTSTYGQKNVCMKRIYTGPNGVRVVNRECRLVSTNLKTGHCPDDLYEKSKNVEFCRTCEHDGCNSANRGLQTINLMTIIGIPAALALFLRN